MIHLQQLERRSSTLPAILILALALLALTTGAPRALGADTPSHWLDQHMDELVQLYRHFHAHPELSYHEKETAARVAEELEAVGADVTRDVGGHGVVGVLRNGPGPILMLRTDLDALPVTEQTGLVYASQVRFSEDAGQEVGVMHACGHDVHMTNLIAVARYLAHARDQWSGTILFVGQPAEERGTGARAMLSDGLFDRFGKPDFAIALHADALRAAGTVGFRSGYAMANTDSVDIVVKGSGGHGAWPHTTIDPIVQAAELVISLQTIVSREVKPLEPAVITVGSIHGGTKHNVIGDRCHLQITVRSYSDEVRQQLLTAIRRRANAIATAYRAPEPEILVTEGTPSLRNDPQLTERVVAALRRVLGDERVSEAEPTMGGEDFSQYGLAGVPVFMYWLGSVEPQRLERYRQVGQQPPSLHSPSYYPDIEPTLRTGVTTMVASALELLPKKP